MTGAATVAPDNGTVLALIVAMLVVAYAVTIVVEWRRRH